MGCGEVGEIDQGKLFRQEKMFTSDSECKGKPLASFKGLEIIFFTLQKVHLNCYV